MRTKITPGKITASLLVAMILMGCAGKSPTQKEVAKEQWNTARASVLMSLAGDQYRSGNLDKARQTTDEALRMDPKNSVLRVLSARLAIEKGELDLADRELKLASELDQKNPDTDYLTGVVYQRWQQLPKALEAYQTSMAKVPTDPAPLLATAELMVQLDRTDEAIYLLASRAGQFEHNPVLHDALGQLLLQQNRAKEAVVVLRQAQNLDPEDPSIREHLAQALFETKQPRECADVLDRLLRQPIAENRADLLTLSGQCRLQLGQTREARACFERATRIDDSNTDAWLGLARTALEIGDLSRAETSSRKAMAINAGFGEAHLLLGYVRLKQNRLSEALTSFQKASALDPGDSVSLCMVGLVLEKTGHADQAVSYYVRALQLKPSDDLAKELMAGAGE